MDDHNHNPLGKGGFKDNPSNINRLGRPKNPALTVLKEAIANIEKETGKTLFEHYVRLALQDKNVLMDLMKKLVANCASLEVDVNAVTIADLMQIVQGQKSNEKKDTE